MAQPFQIIGSLLLFFEKIEMKSIENVIFRKRIKNS